MTIDLSQLDNLLTYCTPNQSYIVNLIKEHGSFAAVSRAIGKDESTIRKTYNRIREKAAMAGYAPEANLNHSVPQGFSIKRVSTLTNKDGEKTEWVIKERDKEDQYNAIIEALNEAAKSLEGKIPLIPQEIPSKYNLMNNYISNDLHIGALHWGKETGDRDYDLKEADTLIRSAIDYLVETSPRSKYALISDLGDMLEIDDFKNSTPKSGHGLDVDGRYSKILTVAIDAMIYMVEKALQYHDVVYFLNIAGNHDVSTAHAIREGMRVAFRNNPRAIMDISPRSQKYLKYGRVLLGYAHGEGLKMSEADGTMTVDCIEFISESVFREYHFGHNHKDKIYDGKVCKSESHRNLTSLNGWASHAGFRRQLGTMKCITYCPINGRKSVNIFNVDMDMETISDAEPMLLQ